MQGGLFPTKLLSLFFVRLGNNPYLCKEFLTRIMYNPLNKQN